MQHLMYSDANRSNRPRGRALMLYKKFDHQALKAFLDLAIYLDFRHFRSLFMAFYTYFRSIWY
jgi:hypothetical protein